MTDSSYEPNPNPALTSEQKAILDRGAAQFEQARALCDREQFSESLAHWEQAFLEYQTLVQDEGFYLARAALAQGNWAYALQNLGQLSEACRLFEKAHISYKTLTPLTGATLVRWDAAWVQRYWANTLRDLGQLDEACKHYEQAHEIYKTLIAKGGTLLLEHAALLQVDWADTLRYLGQLDEACKHHELAYASLITLNTPLNVALAQCSRANTLTDLGQLGDAFMLYEQAHGICQTLVATGAKPSQRMVIAWVQCHLANALKTRGKLNQACGLYEKAYASLRALTADGKKQHLAQAAWTQMNWADALVGQAKYTTAITKWLEALTTWSALVAQGQAQHRSNLNELANKVLRHQRAARTEWNLEAHVFQTQWLPLERMALTAVAAAPADFRKVTSDALQSQLRDTAFTLDAWDAEADKDKSQAQAWQSVAHHWLEQMTVLLEEHAHTLPDMFETEVKPWAQTVLRGMVARQDRQGVMLWHLRTQGVHAQRKALLVGLDANPDAQNLHHIWGHLDELRYAMGKEVNAALDKPTLHVRNAPQKSEAYAEFDRLWTQEFEPLRARLERAGQLPATLRLDVAQCQQALASLPERTALALVIPLDEANGASGSGGRSWVVCCLLPPERDAHQESNQGGDARITLHSFLSGLPSNEGPAVLLDRLGHAFMTQHGQRALRGGVHHIGNAQQDDSAEADRTEATRNPAESTDVEVLPTADTPMAVDSWVRKLLQKVMQGGKPQKARTPAAESSNAIYAQTPQDAAEPCLARWQDAPLVLTEWLGRLHRHDMVQQVHVVPADDLHLLPWAATLDQQVPGLVVRQFPTTAAWWRCMQEAPVKAQPMRWASLAYDARESKPLPWVGVEARAVAALMPQRVVPLTGTQPSWDVGQTQDAVQGLLGMGHGDAPQGNWALAGLVLDLQCEQSAVGPTQYKASYLDASKLYLIKHVQRLVMSCCVLGRVRDAQGEPVGMTALAFGYKTRFAVGAMVAIPDMEGALWSVALHWAWAQAEQQALQSGEAMDWSGVFHATRREVLAGRWPQGFDAWLTKHLWHMAIESGDGLDDTRYVDAELALKGAAVEPFLKEMAKTPSASVRQVAALFTCLG